MLDFAKIDNLLQPVDELKQEGLNLAETSKTLVTKNINNRETLEYNMKLLQDTIEESKRLLDDLELRARALMLVGSATDKSVEDAITKVTMVINQALLILFPKDRRAVSIKKSMYRNRYLHFEVVLETGTGNKRSFKMSGTGLAQVVSCLFNVAFVDISGGRKFIVMDEVLNGLHPKAKILIRELLLALRDYQFLIIEHSLDIGKQYEAVMDGQRTFLRPYTSNNYYSDFTLKTRGYTVEEEGSSLRDENGNSIVLSDNTVSDIPDNFRTTN